jgi:2-methylcitrate dehydratase PrpD
VRDPEVRALMKRVTMEVDPEIPGELERHMWTRVTIRLADGRTVSIGPREVPGHPGNPLAPAAREDKFAECAGLALPADRVAVVAEMLERLEACPDLRSLTAVLAP